MEFVNAAHERAGKVPEHLREDKVVEVQDADESERGTDFGIGVEVVSSATSMVHEDTGEDRGFMTQVSEYAVLFDPENEPSKTPPWMSWEEAWETIQEDYDWENPEKYLDEVPSDGFARVVPYDRMMVTSRR